MLYDCLVIRDKLFVFANSFTLDDVGLVFTVRYTVVQLTAYSFCAVVLSCHLFVFSDDDHHHHHNSLLAQLTYRSEHNGDKRMPTNKS